jgi:hypothetical protein
VLKVLALFLSLQERPQDLPPAQAPPPAEARNPLEDVRGNLRVWYRYRRTPSDSDSDFYELLTVTYGNPEKDLVSGALTVRFAEDTDGNQNVQGFYPFTSLEDSYKNPATQLYTAYLDLRPDEGRWLIRGGRQILDEFPEAVPMDGGLVRYRLVPQVTVSAFGGVPVNPYESSPQGDVMYGASAEWRPEAEGRARYRIEYMHIRDDNTFGLHRDDLVGFSIDEGYGPLNFFARYTILEGESRDLVGRVTASVPDADFQAQVLGTYVFHQIQALSYPLDPYASFLMDLEPYVDLTARAFKGFGTYFSIDGSFTARELVGSGVETTYNHSFKRAEIAPMLRNWPLEGFTLRVAGDYWNSDVENFWTWGIDLSIPLHRTITLSAGSSYSLYSVDQFTGEEHDRVRLYTVALKWQVNRQSCIEARVTREENSVDTFHIIEMGFRHAF